MGAFPLSAIVNSLSKQVTGGAAHTLGSNTELISAASMTTAIKALHLSLRGQNTSRHHLLQLYTGGSGAEAALGEPIGFRGMSANSMLMRRLAVNIPSGTRISCKVQDSTGSGAVLVNLLGQEAGTAVPDGPAASASSWVNITPHAGGTSQWEISCDAGGTINTFNATTLNASTASAVNRIEAIVRHGVAANVDFAFKIKVGSTVIFQDYIRGVNGTPMEYSYGPFDHDIPAGSSVTAEVSCSGNTVGSRELFIGVTGQLIPDLSSGALVATEDDVQYEIRPLSGASQVLGVDLVDTEGDPLTGLDHTDVTCYLSVDSAAPAQQVLVDATVGVYTSLGFKEVSAANMAGRYMFCPATLPSSGKRATFLFTATGMRPARLHVDLVASEPRAASLTAQDVVAAELAALGGFSANATNVTINGVSFTVTRTPLDSLETMTAD